MKKITAIVMVALMLCALLLPVMADESPARTDLEVETKADMPEATAESPDFVFVKDEATRYAKYEAPDEETGYMYVPEGEVEYEIDPKTAEWTKGSTEGLTFRSTAEFAKFAAVIVDNKVVGAANYDASEGSTVIAFTVKRFG